MFKVLLVDESGYSRERIKKMLDWKLSGFILEAYADYTSDVLSLIDKHDFSLILINIKGANSEGLLLCSRIRQQSHVPLILIGGDYDFEFARKALIYQVNDILPDPVQAGDLMASLQDIKKKLVPNYSISFSAASPLAFQSDKKDHTQTSIIDNVKKYVQEEMHHNVTLKEVSNYFHFNSAYLGQKFKNEENMTFNEYLLQQRMERAKLLLEQTNMRIYEIANEVGYTEIDWFYKKFKEYTGVSANSYRKQVFVTA